MHHRSPVDRLEIDVEAGPGQDVGGDLRLGPDGGIIGRRENDDLFAVIAGGGQVFLQFGIILGAAGDFDAGRARHRRSGHEQTDIGLVK